MSTTRCRKCLGRLGFARALFAYVYLAALQASRLFWGVRARVTRTAGVASARLHVSWGWKVDAEFGERRPMAAVDLVPPTLSLRRIAAVAGGEANWRFRPEAELLLHKKRTSPYHSQRLSQIALMGFLRDTGDQIVDS